LSASSHKPAFIDFLFRKEFHSFANDASAIRCLPEPSRENKQPTSQNGWKPIRALEVRRRVHPRMYAVPAQICQHVRDVNGATLCSNAADGRATVGADRIGAGIGDEFGLKAVARGRREDTFSRWKITPFSMPHSRAEMLQKGICSNKLPKCSITR